MFVIKLLNVVPQKEKNRRKKSKILVMVFVGMVVLAALLAYPSIQLHVMENELAEAEENVELGRSLQNEIDDLQREINNGRNTISNIQQESLPLNYFLLFMSTEIPDDVRIYQVVSETFGGEEVVEEEDTEEAEGDEGEESREGPVAVVETHNQDIIVKGSAEKSKSIADLMYDLEKNEYVEYVDIKETENYYSGVSDYELFELYINIK